jgi:hypothetical protein
VSPRARKLLLTLHVTSSVGWLGAVLAYLAPAVIVATSPASETAHASHAVMRLIGWYVLVPLSLATLVTGLAQSLLTEWGLIRHYWVTTKLVLAVIGTVILVVHLSGMGHGGGAAHAGPHLLVHAIGGLVLLLIATLLSIFKPWGKTAYGKRRAS